MNKKQKKSQRHTKLQQSEQNTMKQLLAIVNEQLDEDQQRRLLAQFEPDVVPPSEPSEPSTSEQSSEQASEQREQPTNEPSQPTSESNEPSVQPSEQPSQQQSQQQSEQPSEPSEPTSESNEESVPTSEPNEPTNEPSEQTSEQSTSEPSKQSTSESTSAPPNERTSEPNEQPSKQSTSEPSQQTIEPTSEQPSEQSTSERSQSTSEPTSEPSEPPSEQPNEQPKIEPTSEPNELQDRSKVKNATQEQSVLPVAMHVASLLHDNIQAPEEKQVFMERPMLPVDGINDVSLHASVMQHMAACDMDEKHTPDVKPQKHVTFQVLPCYTIGIVGDRVNVRLHFGQVTIEDVISGREEYMSLLKAAADHSLLVFYDMGLLDIAKIPDKKELANLLTPLHPILEQKLACWAAHVPANPAITTLINSVLVLFRSKVPGKLFNTKEKCAAYLQDQRKHIKKEN